MEFVYTDEDNFIGLFKHGCDILVESFDEEFKKSF